LFKTDFGFSNLQLREGHIGAQSVQLVMGLDLKSRVENRSEVSGENGAIYRSSVLAKENHFATKHLC